MWCGARENIFVCSVVGGGLGAVALLILPFAAVNKGWRLPLLLDWGSLPRHAYALF